MDSPPDPFQDALAAAARNESRGWEWLYHRFAPSVLGYLRSQRVSSPEDLLGDVWLQVVRDLPRFTGEEEAQFRGWLVRIAHNRLIDAHRSEQRRPRTADVETPDQPDEQADVAAGLAHEESMQRLQRLLEGLPHNQRAVIYMRFVLDMPQQDVAAALGMSTAGVKMLQLRATKKVARRLEDEQRHGGGAE